jgi:peroxiredoxin
MMHDKNAPEQLMTSLSAADTERLRKAFVHCREMEGTLGQQLAAYAKAGREIFPAYGEAVDRLVARIKDNGGGENAPRPGEAIPPFVLPDETGRLVSLSSLLNDGPVAVMFFRGHWCPYCRLNVRAVAQAMERIRAVGGQVVAIMPETQAFAEKFKAEGAVPFAVLTDLDNGYALSLNLAIWLGTEIQRLLSHQGLARFQDNDGWVLPIPANVRGRTRRACQSTLRRPRFPRADGNRRFDCGLEARRQELQGSLTFAPQHPFRRARQSAPRPA